MHCKSSVITTNQTFLSRCFLTFEQTCNVSGPERFDKICVFLAVLFCFVLFFEKESAISKTIFFKIYEYQHTYVIIKVLRHLESTEIHMYTILVVLLTSICSSILNKRMDLHMCMFCFVLYVPLLFKMIYEATIFFKWRMKMFAVTGHKNVWP